MGQLVMGGIELRFPFDIAIADRTGGALAFEQNPQMSQFQQFLLG